MKTNTLLKITGIALLSILIQINAYAQYKFTPECKAEVTSVKNQQNTGTCWSFATASFLESELIRMGNKNPDLSEMFVVRNIYQEKAKNYILRQGKANFSQGSLAHDLIAAIEKYGAMPESAYNGMTATDTGYDHEEMETALKGMLDGVLTQKTVSSKWLPAFNGILDAYMGKAPSTFMYEGKEYTPKSYAETLGLKLDNYVSISSFTHHPFYEEFVLEVPDNFSNGSFHNVPLNEFEEVLDHALQKGYTISWDTDVSESTFSAGNGLAILPTDANRADMFTNPGAEIEVTQALRQQAFENYTTTDDHLMHIIGIAKDQTGNKYYIVKNSWGSISEHEGYLYVSAAYFRMKSISIMLHKDGTPKQIASKLGF